MSTEHECENCKEVSLYFRPNDPILEAGFIISAMMEDREALKKIIKETGNEDKLKDFSPCENRGATPYDFFLKTELYRTHGR